MKLHSYLAEGRTGCNMYVVEIFHVNDLLRNIPAHSSPCHVLQICTESHCNSFLSLTTDLLNFSVCNLHQDGQEWDKQFIIVWILWGQYCDHCKQVLRPLILHLLLQSLKPFILHHLLQSPRKESLVVFPYRAIRESCY